MERLTPLETGSKVAVLAVNALHFVAERLKGGAWADLPRPNTLPPPEETVIN